MNENFKQIFEAYALKLKEKFEDDDEFQFIDDGGEYNESESGEIKEETKLEAKFCLICKENLSKYTCPGCQTKTCSLYCIKQHKLSSKCDGKSKKFAYRQ